MLYILPINIHKDQLNW